ncbi:MAG TPA: hypothetical protein VK667_13115 [Ktedonobacteraceae bacterium]|nr:hypothetical protein [Ktedonobacteraceae bacterium]
MNDFTHFNDSADRHNEHVKLARWLQHVLATSKPAQASFAAQGDEDSQAEVVFGGDYHPRFYQQLPDFIMALLRNDPRATIHYAPLLYHLASCPTCHTAYLELYDALRYAVKTGDTQPLSNSGTRPLATIPAGTLVNLCQVLIQQAEAILRQARRDHADGTPAARSLLQLAMRVSANITQSSMRSRALQDLVRVATLFDGPHSPAEQGPASYTYSPLVGAGGPRRGKVVRRADTAVRSGGKQAEQPAIYLQSHVLEGSITQQEDMLELQLHDLNEKLRGHYLSISVPLGSLIEPVRWVGGNPRAIRSVTMVDQDGTVRTPLGQTELRLARPDERNLLEVMFLLLEVRPLN